VARHVVLGDGAAWIHGKAETQPTPASRSTTVLASAAVPLSNTSVTLSRGIAASSRRRVTRGRIAGNSAASETSPG